MEPDNSKALEGLSTAPYLVNHGALGCTNIESSQIDAQALRCHLSLSPHPPSCYNELTSNSSAKGENHSDHVSGAESEQLLEAREESVDSHHSQLPHDLQHLVDKVVSHMRAELGRVQAEQCRQFDALCGILQRHEERWQRHLTTTQEATLSLQLKMMQLEARVAAQERHQHQPPARPEYLSSSRRWTPNPSSNDNIFLVGNTVVSSEASASLASVGTPEERSEQDTNTLGLDGDDEADVGDAEDGDATDSDTTPQRRIVSNLESMILWERDHHPHSDRRVSRHCSTRAVRSSEVDANSSIATRSTATGSTMASTIVTTSVAPFTTQSTSSVLLISSQPSDDVDDAIEAGTVTSQRRVSWRGNSQSPLTIQSHEEELVHTSAIQLSSNVAATGGPSRGPRSSSLRTSIQAPQLGGHLGGRRGPSSYHSNPLRVVSFTPDTTIVFSTRSPDNDDGIEAGVDSIITMPEDVDTEDYDENEDNEPVEVPCVTESARLPDAGNLLTSPTDDRFDPSSLRTGDAGTVNVTSSTALYGSATASEASESFAANVLHWREEYEARLSALERRFPKE